MTDQKTYRVAIVKMDGESIDVVTAFDERALHAAVYEVWEL